MPALARSTMMSPSRGSVPTAWSIDDPRAVPAAHQRQLTGLEADGSRDILFRMLAADEEGDTRRIASPAARGLRRRGWRAGQRRDRRPAVAALQLGELDRHPVLRRDEHQHELKALGFVVRALIR